jgi:hypothetical protein
MRKFVTFCAVALVVPAYAAADGTNAKSDAEKQCRSERTAMGAQIFKDTYGTNNDRSNAFGKCVSHRTSQNKSTMKAAHENAVKQCKAERAADPAAFAAKYGTGKNHKNAFGNCVSRKSKAKTNAAEARHVKAEINAAKQCKAERKADPAAFKAKYGTNKNKSNAFGKCVSTKAKA